MQNRILRLLEEDATLTAAQIASVVGAPVDEVKQTIEQMERDKVILGYKTIIDWDKTDREVVTAFIEVKVMPHRGLGFEKVAKKLYSFAEVRDVYLMSGGFDIAVLIEGKTMKEVALFVAKQLAVLEGVTSTSTHFVLKKYKDKGVVNDEIDQDKRGMF